MSTLIKYRAVCALPCGCRAVGLKDPMTKISCENTGLHGLLESKTFRRHSGGLELTRPPDFRMEMVECRGR